MATTPLNPDASATAGAPAEAAPKPTSKITPLHATLEQARQGDPQSLQRLGEILDEYPGIWQQTGDLVRLVEETWLKRIAGQDLLHSQSIRRYVEQLRLELGGASPSPLERLIVDRLIATWLAVEAAELTEALTKDAGATTAALLLKRSDSANRRILAAAKALAQVRRLAAGIRIEIQHSMPAPSTSAGPAAARDDACDETAPHRLNGLMRAEQVVAST